MTNEKVYFAHSKRDYDTKIEEEIRNWLRTQFVEVICPNENMGELGDMRPYIEMIDTCDMVVCKDHKNHIGRGVYAEIEHALRDGKKVFLVKKVKNEFKLIPVTDIELDDVYDWKVCYGKLLLRKDLTKV